MSAYTDRHICVLCSQCGDESSCVHRGTWHSSYRDCTVKCALKLGWDKLGLQHYSCCYKTKQNALCPFASHLYHDAAQTVEIKSSLADIRSDCRSYAVNLDAPPRERWTHIIRDHLEYIPAVSELIDGIIGTGMVASLATAAFSGLTKVGHVYYSEELQGIAEASGLPVGKIALMQIAYEVFAACTSIIIDAPGSDGGKTVPFHIRTMDWDMEELKPLTIEVNFVRGGVTVFKATTWAGYVGVLTGMRPEAFSVSINYRRSREGHERGLLRGVMSNMVEGLTRSWPVSFLVREALDRCATYSAAVGALRESDLMAPTYITVAGVSSGEGIVITRNRNGCEADQQLVTSGFIVQANMDHFLDDAEDVADEDKNWQDICESRLRRRVARVVCASILDRGATESPALQLWSLVSVRPCLAHDTVYTVAMQASSGLYTTRVNVRSAHSSDGRTRWGALIREASSSSSSERDTSSSSARRR
jgi:hypothetical protein